ncbi:MAG: hypothetical protein K1X44_07365 [Alphaproteobacteria bacterium]|nr:hypothetical protein [Alphaproteobacteria bacterium]
MFLSACQVNWDKVLRDPYAAKNNANKTTETKRTVFKPEPNTTPSSSIVSTNKSITTPPLEDPLPPAIASTTSQEPSKVETPTVETKIDPTKIEEKIPTKPTEPVPLSLASLSENPQNIIGIDQEKVKNLLGEPFLVKRDPPAEVWQYKNDQCILDLFLYEQSSIYRVLYIETRTPKAETIAAPMCFKSIFSKKATG